MTRTEQDIALLEKIDNDGAFSSIYDGAKRRKLIMREKGRLLNWFKASPVREQAIRLIDEAAFLRVSCEELRLIMQRDGVIETYRNGANQYGLKRSAAAESYDKFLSQLLKVTKQIRDLADVTGQSAETSELLAFIAAGR